MPATEQIWRNPKTMHAIFAATSVVMLVATVWMLADDHAAEYKSWQAKAEAIDQWTIAARIKEEVTAQYDTDLTSGQAALREARASVIDDKLIEEFKRLVAEDAKQRGDAAPGMAALDKAIERLRPLAAEADKARDEFAQARGKLATLIDKAEQVENQDTEEASKASKAVTQANLAMNSAAEALKQAESAAAAARSAALAAIDRWIKEARLREENLTRAAKTQKANLDAKTSERDIAVGQGDAKGEARLQAEVDALKGSVDKASAARDAAKEHRADLDEVVRNITAEEIKTQKNLDALQGDVNRLRENYVDFEGNPLGAAWQEFWDWTLRMPVLDAFYTGERKIDPGWLPDLTININFRDIARFDRCATCHQFINKTAPGSAVEPAYEHERMVRVELTTPDEAPAARIDEEGESRPANLLEVYGVQFAPAPLKASEVAVLYTLPESRSAKAGLEMGDVIEEVGGARINTPEDLEHYLLETPVWGQPLELTVRRGLPHPFASHPRLDLFVGTSPHPKERFGCTICHDGQGGGTEFRWASHTPNNPDESVRWYREHGWFDNPHWIYPMYPERFVESGCLKCHHDVTELEPSERFPDPPAPKLVSGYKLLQEYGCYACHEINGYDGPNRRIGPDLRVETNYAPAAQAILTDPHLTDAERQWALWLVERPDDDEVRHQLSVAIATDAEKAKKGGEDAASAGKQKDTQSTATAAVENAANDAGDTGPRLSATTHALGSLLTDVEAPGELRKVGPSLRYIASKVDFAFLYDWVRQPRDFRPSTRMPQFFGQWGHLDIEKTAQEAASELLKESSLAAMPELKQLAEQIKDKPSDLAARLKLREAILADRESKSPKLPEKCGELAAELVDDAERFEPIEIRAITQYLLNESRAYQESQPFEYVAPVEGAEPPSVERGRHTFQTRGCLACHTHKDFPGIAEHQGPDLSRVGGKFNTEEGRKWLYSWIKQPNRYHVRTRMPNMFLDPITGEDGKVIDPAADVVEFLLSNADWKPANIPSEQLNEEEKVALADLALEHLRASFPARRAKQYLAEGIPDRLADRLKSAEKTLLQSAPGTIEQKQLRYVGVQTINKMGCFGCHDIPGFETAKPIGTPLADWGRKDPSRLAFEQIQQFFGTHGIDGQGRGAHDDHGHSGGGHGHGLDPFDEAFDDDEGYYLQALAGHHREGFIWQKLRMPRSYDYKKTRNKGYNERLRMPLFTFNYRDNRTEAENALANKTAREEIITFVLGLVNEPPAESYIYHPGPRRQAIIEGLQVAERYNCIGCHVLRMDRWELTYQPTTEEQQGDFLPAEPFDGFPFLAPWFTPEQVKQSLKLDHRGLRHAVVHGQAVRNQETGQPEIVDEEGIPIEEGDEELEPYNRFTLWKNALVDGQPRLSGIDTLPIPQRAISTKYEALGGHLARYLFPVVIADEKARNPQVKGSEAWGWLPPPLVGEGLKVQTDWVHDFLLDPYPIRPAVVLRMPKFNMTTSEARALANYFAAVDEAVYPYEFNPRRGETYLASAERQHKDFLSDAMKIVLNNNFCVQCHLVGDFRPKGSTTAMGPNLDDVYRRLRPDWVRRWVANPKRITPYTGMPQNVPYHGENPVVEGLFSGTSTEQVDGLVDLLMNFDRYVREQTSFRSLVKPAAPAEPDAATGAAQ